MEGRLYTTVCDKELEAHRTPWELRRVNEPKLAAWEFYDHSHVDLRPFFAIRPNVKQLSEILRHLDPGRCTLRLLLGEQRWNLRRFRGAPLDLRVQGFKAVAVTS